MAASIVSRECLSDDASAINSYSKDGFTALHFACFFGQPEAARLLIDSGAAIDAAAANPMQVMPLHSAASTRNFEAARLLLEHGAAVNARQQGGWVPIHAAAQNGDCPMIDLLLKHGADPGLANDEGKTAAMVAREKGHEEIGNLAGKIDLFLFFFFFFFSPPPPPPPPLFFFFFFFFLTD